MAKAARPASCTIGCFAAGMAAGSIGIRSTLRPSASVASGLDVVARSSVARVADLELAEAREEDAGVVGDGVGDVRRAGDAHRSRAQQGPQRRLVLAEAELAQALQADGAGVRRLARDQRVEGVARLGVALALVERRGEIPAAFVPGGAPREAAAIERDGVVEPPRFAGRGGLGGERVERGPAGRFACAGFDVAGFDVGFRGLGRRALDRQREGKDRGDHGWRAALPPSGSGGRIVSGSRRSTAWPATSSRTVSTSS